MRKTYFLYSVLIVILLVSGCAASSSAQEEQQDTLMKQNENPSTMHTHTGTGMNNASKAISPITN